MKTVALFGGSFDPPHIGHEAIVNALVKLEFIDEVVVMPTFLNPFKSESYADSSLRLEWLQKIFSPLKKVHISSFEARQNKKVPTIESVRHLLQKYEKVYLVIGADNLLELHKWHKFEELEKLVTFIVASRNGIKISNKFIRLDVDENISSSDLREHINTSKLAQESRAEIEKYYKEYNGKS